MSDSNEKTAHGASKNVTRNLPSWMSSRGDENKSFGKKPVATGDEENSDGKVPKQSKEGKLKNENTGISFPPSSGASNFCKLLEGVVFALSGFVNPERSVLRSQALEMGAQYQPDWNPNCTLLICAFPNTPKFRQVKADCGTIVSKEWISECYSQKKLVDIDSYLMYAGKPWRKQKDSLETSQDLQSAGPKKSQKKVDGGSQRKPTSKTSVSNPASFSPAEVKKWAIDDLDKTISWLHSQEEKPEASKIKNIAAEGILTCLQDAIDSLKDNQDIQPIVEQWNFIPRAVEELAKLDRSANGKGRLLKGELCKEAMAWKRIYKGELSSLKEDSAEKKRARNDFAEKTYIDYDSDETIEMTEEEIDLAFSNIASTLAKD